MSEGGESGSAGEGAVQEPVVSAMATGSVDAEAADSTTAGAAPPGASGGEGAAGGAGGADAEPMSGDRSVLERLNRLAEHARAAQSRDRLAVASRRVGFLRLTKLRNVVSGADLLAWLRRQGMSASEAAEAAADMLRFHVIHKVARGQRPLTAASGAAPRRDVELKAMYRFQRDERTGVCNAARIHVHVDASPPPSAVDVAARLRHCMRLLFDEFLSADGREVNYAGMAASPELAQYRRAAEALQAMDVAELSAPANADAALAFWINVYNALVIDSTLQMGKPQTAMQRGAYFNTAAYTIGGRLYTLNDIEHGVLRCNAKPVGALRPRFGRGDDRLRFSRRGPVDPRLHFALNCGARSCPVVRLYSAERVQAELDEAAAAFCGSDRHFYVAGLGEPVDVEVEEETPVEAREMYGSGEPVARAEQPNEVTLSKIFGWYQVDFVTAWRASGGAQSNGKGSYELMRWCMRHLPPAKREAVAAMLGVANTATPDAAARAAPATGNVKVKYFVYDWAANGTLPG